MFPFSETYLFYIFHYNGMMGFAFLAFNRHLNCGVLFEDFTSSLRSCCTLSCFVLEFKDMRANSLFLTSVPTF